MSSFDAIFYKLLYVLMILDVTCEHDEVDHKRIPFEARTRKKSYLARLLNVLLENEASLSDSRSLISTLC